MATKFISDIKDPNEENQTQISTDNIADTASTITLPSAIEPSQGLGQAITEGSQARADLVSEQVSTNLTQPQIPQAAVQTFTSITEQAGEITDPTDPRFQVGAQAPQISAETGTAAPAVQVPTGIDATQMTAQTVGQGAAGTEQAATQTALDPATAAQAALGELPEEALVQSQMEELTQGIQDGNIPVWAQPAADAVEAQLAARGLSRSSVGQAALTNAIIQSALPMAQQNAQAVTANFAQDKQNQQQTNLFNAQAAQQFQLQSLSNEQQMAIQNSNLRQQAMLSDQSATNASRQFNAANESQTQQFMATMQANIDSQNAARADSMQQFNAQQTNAMDQFLAQNQFARDQFNAQNATQIEQSNLQWRRQMNQTNTAGVNAVNQANAMNAFNMSNQALTFMWQEMRDAAKWSFEAAQNDEQRAAALAQAALQNEGATSTASTAAMTELGKSAINIWKELRD